MQVLKDTLLYSNIHASLDKVADDEREILVQEQKACRARARQFSQETNRRRKALEERRMLWDVQEQKLRENILQQRKQRLQEATERFQRSHLPLSQRMRPVCGQNALNLDEALSHIQGYPDSNPHPSTFFSSINRTYTSSPKPPGGFSSPQSVHAISAAEAYTKLMQDRSLGDFRTNQLLLKQLQETETPLKDNEQILTQVHLELLQCNYKSCRRLYIPKTDEHSNTPISPAESLSSLDSLENEIPQQDQSNKPVSLDQSEVHDTKGSSALPSKPLNFLCPLSNSCPSKNFLEEVLYQQSQLCSSNSSSPSPGEDESTDEDRRVQSPLETADQCGGIEHSKTSNIKCTLSAQQTLTDNLGYADYTSQTTPCNTQLEFLSLTQRSCIDSGELGLKEQTPLETRDSLFNGSSNLLQGFSCTGLDLAIDEAESASACQSTKTEQCIDSTKVLEKATKLHSEMTEEPERPAEPLENRLDFKSNNVQFLKGILKTKSKCLGDVDSKFIYTPGHFVFSKDIAKAIRDSLELRNKGKDPDSNKCMKKKLRWFDEVNIDWVESDDKVNGKSSKQAEAKNRLHQQVHQHQVSNHSGYINIPSRISKTDLIYSGPARSSSTKQAWSDIGRQQEPSEMQEASRMQKTVPRMNGYSIPRRARSTRNVSAPGSFRARRGTMIRTQSASQLQNVVRTQGKTLVPRPPPRSEGNSVPATMYAAKTASNNEPAHCQRHCAVEQDLYNDYAEGQPVVQGIILKTNESSVLAPVPPSYAYMYETMSKGIYSLCGANGQTSKGTNGLQNGICLNRTPTDEEISMLWNGVRSALASKDDSGDPQSVQAHSGALSSQPQSHANSSHVSINDNNALGNGKALARMGGFLFSSSNSKDTVRSPVRRPALQGNMMKNSKGQRIQAAALGDRKPCIFYQTQVPINRHLHKADQMAPDQGSVVMDGDDQVAVDSPRQQRGSAFTQSQRGISALSLEEQKLLQSLDRLNHRLQYVQDVAARNTALKGHIALDSAYSPQTGKASCATLRRYHAVSADSRSRSNRRY
ncbi:centrosomal protein of 126 kDa [Trichomycterus rosablanca]|uniref:centrosomal protein of 126 kDa n=1 Tax=Trichomycterus rosablanca TaxID=2290929 RepID=UPI002F357C9D